MGLNLEQLSKIPDLSLNEDLDETATPTVDPRSRAEFTFDLDYTDGQGKNWSGTFTNKILTLADISRAKVLESRLAGGQPFSSMDPFGQLLHQVLAHLQFSLLVKPQWATDLSELRDVKVLMAIWKEVQDHESAYFRYSDDAPADSDG